MVSTYTQPDFTSQTATAYKTALDDAASVFQRVAGAFAPHAQAVPDMTVRIDAGSVFDGTTLTEVAAQSTGTITAPAVNPRIDRVVVDLTTGAVSVITGAEATSPAAPAITAGTQPVAQVLLQTTTTAIANSMITDERARAAGVPVASQAEAEAGTDNAKTMTALRVAQGTITKTKAILQALSYAVNHAKGADIASATTCDIGAATGNYLSITGSTTITGLGTMQAGAERTVRFTGVLTLTHNATSLILPGAANITTAANDVAEFRSLGSGNWICSG